MGHTAGSAATAVHSSAIVFDGSMVAELSVEHIDRMRRGGVTAVNHTVCEPYAGTVDALRQFRRTREWIQQHADEVELALTPADVRAAKENGREAIVLGPQDTEMIGADLDLLGVFHDLGMRFLQLTYQRQNLIGAGCGEAEEVGLSHLGRDFIAEMNALGIVVDVSHCSQRTGRDAMERSERPVVVTHAFCDALSPHIRAKSDDFIRALGAQGGVMGITTLSGFLYYPDEPRRRPDLKRFAEHVAHAVDLAGVESVAVATDYEETLYQDAYEKSAVTSMVGGWGWQERRAVGMEDGSCFPNITQALMDQGFSDEEVRLILGENWLRVWEKATA
ncbi:MAG: membrane dipeptidase [Microbacterium sp.]